MEVYCTKKVENAEDLHLDIPTSLPYLHIVTPEVIVRNDHNGNFYISECPSDVTFISNFVKFKKIIAKKAIKHVMETSPLDTVEKDKLKLQDDVIWIKPSANLIYKKPNEHVKLPKMLLHHPIILQLTFSASSLTHIIKPYNTYNIYFSCDCVSVQDSFDWNLLIA